MISPRVCRVDTLYAKRALVLAGVGWARLPLWQIRRDLEKGRLKRLATAALGRGTSEAHLAHRLDEPLGPAARAFAAALTRLVDGP